VAWDAGGTNSYRMGAEGKYDLMLAPSHNPEKTRKDLLSPRSLNKTKGLTVEGADGKNKVQSTAVEAQLMGAVAIHTLRILFQSIHLVDSTYW